MQKALICVLFACIIFFSGCTAQTDTLNYNNNDAGTELEDNDVVSDFEFTVPLELPIAYVGEPYFYSFCSPVPEKMTGFSLTCGVDVTPVNPKGGSTPYSIIVENLNTDFFVSGLYNGGDGMLNFTAESGDEGEYVLSVCAKPADDYNNELRICKNTTLYIMSDIVTIKGAGEFNYSLLFNLKSVVKAADFASTTDEKNAEFGYTYANGFSFEKLTSQVSAAAQGAIWGGGGSYASLEITANENSVSVVADGNAACGQPSYYEGYEVDYYMVGYVGYIDNMYLALELLNTGTKDKIVDVYFNVSSELDSASQNYFDAIANSHLCIDYRHCIDVSAREAGESLTNDSYYRVIVRPGSHWLTIGYMNNNFANTNMMTCPSYVKSSSKASVTILPASINDGKSVMGMIYSANDESDFKEI
ncbi:MAG: hypothetical protein PHN56_02960 [Candidatus Nanoarchaeia archaeon]|nr:hypothetical protein [Candidatus Nanoarchaeia archaeon]